MSSAPRKIRFGTEIPARVYAETRILPPERARCLANVVVGPARKSRTQTVVDIGCGTGRILAGLVQLRGVEVIGVDITEAMLRAVPAWALETGCCRLILRDCRAGVVPTPGTADVALVHWVFNTTEDWRSILEYAVRCIRPSGRVAWFEERGTLYDAIDGRLAVVPESWSSMELEFWRLWYRALGDHGEAPQLEKRPGLPIQSGAPAALLESVGYSIERDREREERWDRYVSLHWIVQRVLVARAFTNLWQIPDAVYWRAVRAVQDYLARYRSAESPQVRLRFVSTPVTAVRRDVN